MTEQKKQMPESAEGFLVQAYRLHAAGETDRALDLVFGWTDAMLKANRSSIVNRALELVNVNLLDEDLLVGIWSATFASRDLLHARRVFSTRATTRLAGMLGEEIATGLFPKSRESGG